MGFWDTVLGAILLFLRTIGLWLDWIVYEVLTYVYALFAVMCRLNFSSLQILLSTIVVRIQILFGVVMLFIVAFNLLTFIIDPSKGSLEKNGAANNLVTKIIVSVGLLVAGNFVFGLLDDLQNAILNENTIEKIVMGADDASSYRINSSDEAASTYNKFIGAGRFISYNLFFSFYTNKETPDLKEDVMNGSAEFYQVVERSREEISYKYPIVSTFCGLLCIVMYITFAIDIGIRAFNIMILRVILPVAAMGYLIPGAGDKILKDYVLTYMKTYAQLFAKIFLSYLIVYLMMALMSLILTQTANGIISQGTIDAFNNQNFLLDFPVFFRIMLIILIFISLYMFYKKLPEMISKILGVEMTSGKGLISKTLGIMGGVAALTLGTTAGIVGGLAGGIAGGIRGKAGFVGTTKAALHNAGQGFKKHAGSGLTKIGNNTIGEKTTGTISQFAERHNSEARAKNRAETEKYANEHASSRVKKNKAAVAQDKADRQKYEEERRLNKLREETNNNSTKEDTQQPPMKEGYNTSSAYASVQDNQEQLNNQRELKETLKRKYQTRQDDELRNQGGQIDSSGTTHAPAKDMGAPSIENGSAFGEIDMNAERKYQTRQDDELRNQGGQMDSSGTTHAPAKDMGAPSIENGSAFGEIDMNAERKYQEQQNQRQPQEESQKKPPMEERKRADELDIDGEERLDAEQIEKNKKRIEEAKKYEVFDDFSGE